MGKAKPAPGFFENWCSCFDGWRKKVLWKWYKNNIIEIVRKNRLRSVASTLFALGRNQKTLKGPKQLDNTQGLAPLPMKNRSLKNVEDVLWFKFQYIKIASKTFKLSSFILQNFDETNRSARATPSIRWAQPKRSNSRPSVPRTGKTR